MNLSNIKKPEITVLIVNYNSADFVATSLYTLSCCTVNTYIVNVLDNGSRKTDYTKLRKLCRLYENVTLERWETQLRSSMAHGTALNYLTSRVTTPFFSILDADATWLKKGWDQVLIDRINDKVKIIGTPPPTGSIKPSDFPLMYAILVETAAFRSLGIDFRPKDIQQAEDTGHELRKKYREAGFTGQVFVMKNTRTYKDGPFADLLGVGEYYLDGSCSEIVASHFGRGSTLGIHKYGHGQGSSRVYKLPFVSVPLRYLRGYFEKMKWIRIAKSIAEKQAKSN